MSERKHKKWTAAVLAAVFIVLALLAGFIAYIDPFFHYHAPLEDYQYILDNDRYQNDGIVRHFTYDGIITGSCLSFNFKTSQAEKLLGGTFVKVPYKGGKLKEVNDNLVRAFTSDNEIKTVIRTLDVSVLTEDKDSVFQEEGMPYYLYNDNIFDDVSYVFNKSVLERAVGVIDYTRSGGRTTSFDDYIRLDWNGQIGPQWVKASYIPGEKVTEPLRLSDSERATETATIEQNITDLVSRHPETEFILFMPPYSIAYWDQIINDGKLEWSMDVQRLAIEKLLEYGNIRLFSFFDAFDTVTDLSRYADQLHYTSDVNEYMMNCFASGEHELTKDNYEQYLNAVRDFYSSYDYSSLYD